MLAHKFLREVLGDLRLKKLRISNELWWRDSNLAAGTQLDKANVTLSDVSIKFLIGSTVGEGNNEIDEKLSIKSFPLEDTYYEIILSNEGYITKYSCVYMYTNLATDEHIFLELGISGHSICFATRDNSGVLQDDSADIQQ